MSHGFLLDTNLLSEQARSRPEPQVEQWLDQHPQDALFLSAITVGEIRRGIALLPSSERRSELDSWLQNHLIFAFAGRILPITQTVAERWGALAAAQQLVGNSLGLADGLIAATALEHELVLVTRNTKHFVSLDVPLLNPWEIQPQTM